MPLAMVSNTAKFGQQQLVRAAAASLSVSVPTPNAGRTPPPLDNVVNANLPLSAAAANGMVIDATRRQRRPPLCAGNTANKLESQQLDIQIAKQLSPQQLLHQIVAANQIE